MKINKSILRSANSVNRWTLRCSNQYCYVAIKTKLLTLVLRNVSREEILPRNNFLHMFLENLNSCLVLCVIKKFVFSI